ncbi:sensor histidine kinase [Bacteroides sp. 214]|uniref:sensor histidine kinase n=1 Tax=Bacteroides sp. 214 TaxID=2302935 RepID=UPI0013D454DA|nr:sensor histidine kinase [Bacteroides sp. 214]NDW12975.1 sensor histidine kinase [Bacteroides sp. 214]
MRQSITQRRHSFEVFTHVATWVLLLLLPMFVLNLRGPNITWYDYTKHFVVIVTYFIVFYFNYYFLIPNFLFKEKTKTYIIYNVIILVLTSFLLHYWHFITAPPPVVNPEHAFRKPPRWVFIIRDSIAIAFTISISMVIRITKRWNALETARREAERSKTEAELKNLRNQLNPHFLLNTLNNIYALIAFDVDKAQSAVQELSKLLRHMLYENQQGFVTLGKEADFMHNYIELMRIRLAPNVTLETKIEVLPDTQTPIAPFLFISLIENAFKHGISPTQPSYIRIMLSETEGKVLCEIANSYFPKKTNDKSGSGIGLPQVAKRLELLYPGKYNWQRGTSADGDQYISRLSIEV